MQIGTVDVDIYILKKEQLFFTSNMVNLDEIRL